MLYIISLIILYVKSQECFLEDVIISNYISISLLTPLNVTYVLMVMLNQLRVHFKKINVFYKLQMSHLQLITYLIHVMQ